MCLCVCAIIGTKLGEHKHDHNADRWILAKHFRCKKESSQSHHKLENSSTYEGFFHQPFHFNFKPSWSSWCREGSVSDNYQTSGNQLNSKVEKRHPTNLLFGLWYDNSIQSCSSMVVSISWIWEEKLSHSFWRPSVIANNEYWPQKTKRWNSNCYALLYCILSFLSIHASKKYPQSVKSFHTQTIPWLTTPRPCSQGTEKTPPT